jgi:hypothetical protein
MSTLPEIAAALAGPMVNPGGARTPVSIKNHVDLYFDILKELEEQTRTRNRPSMRDILNKLPGDKSGS